MLPLAGAELQAAIKQQRSQLRPVQEQQQQQQGAVLQSHGSLGSTRGSVDAGGSGGVLQGGGGAGKVGDGESALEAVLRRGLERFHFGDSGDTHGNTDFIEAAMAGRRDM